MKRLSVLICTNAPLSATRDTRTQPKLGKTGNTFEGVSRFVRTDISGNDVNFCATMSGERIIL